VFKQLTLNFTSEYSTRKAQENQEGLELIETQLSVCADDVNMFTAWHLKADYNEILPFSGFTLMVEVVSSSETSVIICLSAWCYTP
jgi:hypothetical protein